MTCQNRIKYILYISIKNNEIKALNKISTKISLRNDEFTTYAFRAEKNN